MNPLAEIYAAAIIASARTYGDHPIEAILGDVAQRRRCLGPAAFAVADRTGRSRTVACQTLRITRDAATKAAKRDPGRFFTAIAAASRAIHLFLTERR